MTVLAPPNRCRNRAVVVLLACALALPMATPARAETDDMFAVMFRMMLVMMNVMSNSMQNNNTFGGNNWGGLNSFNMGMSTLPMMSGFGSPWNNFGTPWNSFGNTPWGGTPWNSFGDMPYGGTPWNSYRGTPWGGTPWNSFGGTPYGGSSPWGYQDYPYGGDYDYPATWGPNEIPPPNTSHSLLDGRWFGNTGEVLEIRGNRFTLRTSGAAIGGIVRIRNNIITLFSPQTNTTTRYTFLRNQSQLLMDDGRGTVLTFRMHPADAVHVF